MAEKKVTGSVDDIQRIGYYRDMRTYASQLIEALQAKQAAEGLSDRRFAAKLGVDPALWSKTKRGILAPGESIIDAITVLYPDLKPERDFFLRERATIRNEQKADTQQESTR